MICLSTKKQKELMRLFLNRFDMEKKIDDVFVHHPTETNYGCIHIDIGTINNKEGKQYHFSFGCSAKHNPEKRFVEVYTVNSNNIDYSELIAMTAGFNDVSMQLMLLQNGEYVYFDEETPISKISNGKFCGFFIYDSFSVKIGWRKIVYFLELVPATKSELDFVESKNEKISYKSLVLALKNHLGDRSDIMNTAGLSLIELNHIYEELAAKSTN